MIESPQDHDQPRGLTTPAVAVVVAGGSFLGLIGAVIQELTGDPLAAFFGAPMIEEAMKPTGPSSPRRGR